MFLTGIITSLCYEDYKPVKRSKPSQSTPRVKQYSDRLKKAQERFKNRYGVEPKEDIDSTIDNLENLGFDVTANDKRLIIKATCLIILAKAWTNGFKKVCQATNNHNFYSPNCRVFTKIKKPPFTGAFLIPLLLQFQSEVEVEFFFLLAVLPSNISRSSKSLAILA